MEKTPEKKTFQEKLKLIENLSKKPPPKVAFKSFLASGTSNKPQPHPRQSPVVNADDVVSKSALYTNASTQTDLLVDETVFDWYPYKEEQKVPESKMKNTNITGGASSSKNTTTSFCKKFGSDIDLLLIGKTGNGKSALGNSILGYEAFKSEPSTTSVTKEVNYEVCERNGIRIRVVDGPGVGDTDWEDDETTTFVVDAFSSAIAIHPKGYHAFLLVVKFGGRFTKEDKGTVDYLKQIFGNNFVRKYCILIMTHGDLFEKKISVSLTEWLSEQKGVLAELVKECNHRIILFDNETENEVKRQNQISDLTAMVGKLKIENCRYNSEHFEAAQSARDALKLDSQKLLIAEEITNEVNIITQNFKLAQERAKYDNNTSQLDELLKRANELYENIVSKDNKTGVLRELVLLVHSIKSSINDEIRLCHRTAELMDIMKKKYNDQTLSYRKELRRQERQYDRCNLEREMLSDYKTMMLMEEISRLEEQINQHSVEREKRYQEIKDKSTKGHLSKIKNIVTKIFKSKK